MSSAYSRITGNRGDDLADRVIYLMLRLFEGMGYEQKKYRKYIFFNTKHLFTIISEQAENFYPLPQNPYNYYLIQTKSSQRQPEKRTDTLYLWPRSKV